MLICERRDQMKKIRVSIKSGVKAGDSGYLIGGN
jgi:hypothetical protein